jgi:ATP-dependent Clp protease ATP-binding subunit ClpC
VPPELWNRLDERVSFSPLSREDVAKVARLLVTDSSRRLEAERSIRYDATDEAIAFLVAHGGFDAALGARPMRGAIQRLVEAPLAERILAGEIAPGDVAIVDVDGAGGLRISRAARA